METGTQSNDDAIQDARLEAILATTGHALTEAQRTQVLARIAVSLQQAAALRTVALTNADEPEIVFAPFREDT